MGEEVEKLVEQHRKLVDRVMNRLSFRGGSCISSAPAVQFVVEEALAQARAEGVREGWEESSATLRKALETARGALMVAIRANVDLEGFDPASTTVIQAIDAALSTPAETTQEELAAGRLVAKFEWDTQAEESSVYPQQDIATVRDWLRELPSLDMEDIAADGGVTVAMVVQQQAREMAGRLERALQEISAKAAGEQ